MKKAILFLSLCAVLFAFLVLPGSASLINYERNLEWKRAKKQALLDNLKGKKSVKYVSIIFRYYDANRDGSIDKQEAVAIQEFLDETAP